MQVQRCSFSTAQGQHIHDAAVKTAVGNDVAELRAAEDSLTAEARAICEVRARCQCSDGCRHVPRLLAVIPSPEDAAASRARALVFPAYPTCLYEHLQDAKAAHATASAPGPILPLPARLRIFLHITRALSCAARARIAHCDVKPSNIMLNDHGSTVLIDWGLATPHGEYCQGAFGTAAYVPPEMLDPAGFVARPSLDVWSLGVVCLEMVLPRRLTTGLHRDDVHALLHTRELYAKELQQLSAAPEAINCERLWADAILRCLQYNPKRRATLHDLEAFAAKHLAPSEPPPALHGRPMAEVGSVDLAQVGLLDGGSEDGVARELREPSIVRSRHCGTDSSLDGSVSNGHCSTQIPVPDRAAVPAPQSAAEIAASTAAVLRLASVNSSAAFDLLRADADSAALSGANTPGSSAEWSTGWPPAQEPTCHPPSHEAPGRCAGLGLQSRLGQRAASTPGPLHGAQPLSSCELESFDRFTDRPRPTSPCTRTSTLPHPSASDTAPPASPPAQPAAATPLCAQKRTRHPSLRCASSEQQSARLAADTVQQPGSRPCPHATAASVLAAHRHPFGSSPMEPCLPFAADPAITSAPPCGQAQISVPPPFSHTSPESTAHDTILHLQLPRVRTVCHGSGSGDRLPEVADLLYCRFSRGSAGDTQDGCQMSFGKFGAHTPASACARPNANAASAPVLSLPPPPLGGVLEESPSPGCAGIEKPPQNTMLKSICPAIEDSLLFRMDDDGACASAQSCDEFGATTRMSPWLHALHASAERRGGVQKGREGRCEVLEQGGGSGHASDDEDDGSRRRWTYGEVSLHAAHCSVLSDLTDACMPHSPGTEAAVGCGCGAGPPPMQRAQRDSGEHE